MKKHGGVADKEAAGVVADVAMRMVGLMVKTKAGKKQQQEVVVFGKHWVITVERITMLCMLFSTG